MLTTHALSNVEQTKIALGIDPNDTADDAFFEKQINLFSSQFETYCGRHFEVLTRVNEPVSGSGRQYLVLRHRPIVTIQEITIVSVPITDYLPPTPEEAEAGLVFRQYGWFPGNLAIRQGLDLSDPHPTYIFKNISASYTAGYTSFAVDPTGATVTLPADLEACLYREIDRAYCQRLARGFTAQKTPVGHDERYVPSMLLPETQETLNTFKEHWTASQ